ncbi:MAG: ral secretion pathway protein [Patescibacteria group bacterium]|jgi:prepilin-type N-terminal cleavage/methylation domain-containing protein|nr:ral secretion pathway protein [Patescibacteria group bacterium]
MKKSVGFTIVELLIVIVVIGILAAITVIAFSNINAKSRDNERYAEAKTIMKALELYKADRGVYPPNSATTAVNGPGGACGDGSYSYSFATDDSWLRPLVLGGYLTKAPTPAINDCSHYYRYYYVSNPTSYNCLSRTSRYYVLEIVGTDATFLPDDASSTLTSQWRPCSGATAGWGNGKVNWAFSKDEN